MIEYKDGSFGDVFPIDSLIEKLTEKDENIDNIKKIHFGTFDELKRLADNELKRLAKPREPDFDAKISGIQYQINNINLCLNKILLHLGLDDKTEIIVVGEMPKG